MSDERGGAGRPRGFNALVGAQFFGAFNDNLFKQLILILAVLVLFPGKDLQGLAFAVFSLPFVLFSGVAGDLSERSSKRTIIVWMKIAEIGVMGLGILAFMTMSWPLMLITLGIMGIQSAFFGPSKYGVIPELVGPDRLVPANGLITMTTFLAVLTGQALAGPIMDQWGPQGASPALWAPGVACVGFAIIGTLISTRIAPLPPQNPSQRISRSPFGDIFKTIKTLRGSKGLFALVLLNSFFWFNSAVLNQAVNGLSKPGYLAIPANKTTELSYLLATISIGIIVGSLLAPKLARRLGLGRVVFIGATGMVILQAALLLIGTVFGRENGGFWVALALLCAIGIVGALGIVSVQAYLQDAPPPGMRGQTFAVNNFLNFTFMFLAGGFYLLANLVGPTVVQLISAVIMLAYLAAIRRHVSAMRIEEAA